MAGPKAIAQADGIALRISARSLETTMGAIDELPKRNVIYAGTYQGLSYDALVENTIIFL